MCCGLGIILNTILGLFDLFFKTYKALYKNVLRRLSPFFSPALIIIETKSERLSRKKKNLRKAVSYMLCQSPFVYDFHVIYNTVLKSPLIRFLGFFAIELRRRSSV